MTIEEVQEQVQAALDQVQGLSAEVDALLAQVAQQGDMSTAGGGFEMDHVAEAALPLPFSFVSWIKTGDTVTGVQIAGGRWYYHSTQLDSDYSTESRDDDGAVGGAVSVEASTASLAFVSGSSSLVVALRCYNAYGSPAAEIVIRDAAATPACASGEFFVPLLNISVSGSVAAVAGLCWQGDFHSFQHTLTGVLATRQEVTRDEFTGAITDVQLYGRTFSWGPNFMRCGAEGPI